jgi:hypothetical protein
MSARHFLGADQHVRDVMTGRVLMERLRCPGRATTVKPQTCIRAVRPAQFVMIDEFFV